MDQWIKLNGQTNGKDKIAGLLQYLSRFLWYTIEANKRGVIFKDAMLRLKILESTLSSFRRVLRFGKCLDALYAALKSLSLSDPFVRVCSVLTRIYQSLFLLCDHIVWLAYAGLIKLDSLRISKQANRFYLYSIIINLARDLYEIKYAFTLRWPSVSYRKFGPAASPSQVVQWASLETAKTVAMERPDIVCDTLKNGCDLFIPLSSLGKLRLSPGVTGLLGIVSNIIGLLTVINPLYQLKP